MIIAIDAIGLPTIASDFSLHKMLWPIQGYGFVWRLSKLTEPYQLLFAFSKLHFPSTGQKSMNGFGIFSSCNTNKLLAWKKFAAGITVTPRRIIIIAIVFYWNRMINNPLFLTVSFIHWSCMKNDWMKDIVV